ncbi:hypothetical protein XC85_20245 [Klebsiella pneumoniae]|nr:hypothetical protein KPRYC492_25960 [Klebsiella pneumoniae RYC492]KTG55393.1 hypothetical protein K27_14055 [Klebsiella pneumoniae]MDR8548373.1 hypothetical protein [Klebsiella pneumoniae]MDR8554764.1 hypothetical protein [Klebsiella pneumoniae]MDR8600201.1 hypothetical protein [Klebsiella pneumoniae]
MAFSDLTYQAFRHMAVRMNGILQFCDIRCQKLAKNTLFFMAGKAIERHVLIAKLTKYCAEFRPVMAVIA